MKKLSQAFDFQKFQHNPRLDVITHDVESHYEKTTLSDELERSARRVRSPLRP